MAKVKLEIQPENITTYQMKVLLCALLNDTEIDESKVPNSIKKHFKQVTK
jgi:hypothetical protein|tara:strand:- start:544 stop:693 length:150 start_codon:yes stop_codon:yes gene_type:complete